MVQMAQTFLHAARVTNIGIRELLLVLGDVIIEAFALNEAHRVMSCVGYVCVNLRTGKDKLPPSVFECTYVTSLPRDSVKLIAKGSRSHISYQRFLNCAVPNKHTGWLHAEDAPLPWIIESCSTKKGSGSGVKKLCDDQLIDLVPPVLIPDLSLCHGKGMLSPASDRGGNWSASRGEPFERNRLRSIAAPFHSRPSAEEGVASFKVTRMNPRKAQGCSGGELLRKARERERERDEIGEGEVGGLGSCTPAQNP